MSPKPGRASNKGIYPRKFGLSLSQIVFCAGMRIPVNEDNIRFVQLTLEFRYVNLRRETNIGTEPAFRRCPKEHRR